MEINQHLTHPCASDALAAIPLYKTTLSFASYMIDQGVAAADAELVHVVYLECIKVHSEVGQGGQARDITSQYLTAYPCWYAVALFQFLSLMQVMYYIIFFLVCAEHRTYLMHSYSRR